MTGPASGSRPRDFRGATEEFDEAIRLDPGNANAYTNRGFAYNQLGMYQRAIEDLDDAIRLDPDRAEAYNNRAFSYYNVQQYQLGSMT